MSILGLRKPSPITSRFTSMRRKTPMVITSSISQPQGSACHLWVITTTSFSQFSTAIATESGPCNHKGRRSGRVRILGSQRAGRSVGRSVPTVMTPGALCSKPCADAEVRQDAPPGFVGRIWGAGVTPTNNTTSIRSRHRTLTPRPQVSQPRDVQGQLNFGHYTIDWPSRCGP
jgi:hypothetical protein